MNKNTRIEIVVKKLIKVSFEKGQLNIVKVKEVTKTLSALQKGYAVYGLTLYLTGLKKELDRHRLIIESPVKLTQDQISNIVDIVHDSTPVYDTELVVNPELLAGFRIKIGDDVYEDSLEDRIGQLRKAIYE